MTQPLRSAGFGRRTLLAAVLAADAAFARAKAAAPLAVRIDNFTFAPPLLRVPAGSTVEWTNQDDIPHSIVVPALGVHSPPLDTGDSFSHLFEQPGTFDYLCGIHPHMHGRIEVF